MPEIGTEPKEPWTKVDRWLLALAYSLAITLGAAAAVVIIHLAPALGVFLVAFFALVVLIYWILGFDKPKGDDPERPEPLLLDPSAPPSSRPWK